MLARCLPRVLGLAAALVGLGCSASAPPAAQGDGPCGWSIATNSEFCAKQAVPADCTELGYTEEVCGVPLTAPTMPLARSTDVVLYGGMGPPDLSCFEPAHYPVAGAKKTATAQGYARIFSYGCESNSLSIEFFTVVRDGSANEGNVDELVGKATMTEGDCHLDGEPTPTSTCGTRYECPYEYAGLPTETELVVRTTGDQWQPLYEYNVYIPDSAVSASGAWAHDVRALSTNDFTRFPDAAGLTASMMTPGDGFLIGEVHDCADVRLSGALVGVDVPSATVSYFTGVETDPAPTLGQTATSDLGMFAAFELAPGPFAVASIGADDNIVDATGFTTARAYPNAVTMVTFHGVLPFQLTEK